MLAEFATAVVLLAIVVYAFARMLHMEKALGTAVARILSAGFRFGLVMLATLVDAIITVFLMVYHAITVRRADWLADDLAAFLQRLNDRMLRLAIR